MSRGFGKNHTNRESIGTLHQDPMVSSDSIIDWMIVMVYTSEYIFCAIQCDGML
jgi:hypothetical protein